MTQTACRRLLYLCQTLPYPPDSGVHLRSYNILKVLSQSFEVTTLCFYRKSTRRGIESIQKGLDGLRELGEARAHPIPAEHSRLRRVWDHFRSIVTGRVYTRYEYESKGFASDLKKGIEDERFDLVHIDSLDLSAYLPAFDPLPVACTHHNVESELLERRGRASSPPWTAAYLRVQAWLAQREERRWCPRVDLNVVVSERDRDLLRCLAPEARFLVVPNGVDIDYFRPGDSEEEGIVFVGGYGWYPNREGMEFFCEEILPGIRRSIPDVPVTWVGRAPDGVRRRFAERYDVRLTGYVEDVRPYIERSACYVVPLRVGGGTRLKVLDASAMGKAIVSTSLGWGWLSKTDVSWWFGTSPRPLPTKW